MRCACMSSNPFFLFSSPRVEQPCLQRIPSHFNPGKRQRHDGRPQLRRRLQPLQLPFQVVLSLLSKEWNWNGLISRSTLRISSPHKLFNICTLLLRNPWLPGWILTTTLVLSVMVLIWICCATVATAVDQYVPAEVSSVLSLVLHRSSVQANIYYV